MSDLVSIKEARKLLGKESLELTDEQVEKMISDMEFLAQMAIDAYKKEQASI